MFQMLNEGNHQTIFFLLQEDMELIYTEKGGLCMAHNGWVMGDDPLRNFALPGV